jgi:predicted small secreted protein
MNKKFALGAVAFMALLALIFTACPTSSGSGSDSTAAAAATTKLEGTWERGVAPSNQTLEFKGKNLAFHQGILIMDGTIVVSEGSFTFAPKTLNAGTGAVPWSDIFSEEVTYKFTYTLVPDVLTITDVEVIEGSEPDLVIANGGLASAKGSFPKK